MKKINYFGKEYEVSDLVNYVATDKSGSIWGHEVKPYALTGRFIYEHGYLELLEDIGKPAENWKDSLRQVKDIIVKENKLKVGDKVELLDEYKSHPHADLMLKYAMIAQYDDKPWESFEFKNQYTDDWMQMVNSPCWDIENEYRLKPQEPRIQIGQLWMSKEGVDVMIDAPRDAKTIYFSFNVFGCHYKNFAPIGEFTRNFKRKE